MPDDTQILQVRVGRELFRKFENWRRAHAETIPSRAAALRLLIEEALSHPVPSDSAEEAAAA